MAALLATVDEVPMGKPDENKAQGRSSLGADGNCLGVALQDCWRISGINPPRIEWSRMFTVADAVAALGHVRTPVFLMRPGARWPERMLHRLSARWNGWRIRPFSKPRHGELFLCLRSMRQLYAIAGSNAHWVVLEVVGQHVVSHDRLWNRVELSHPNAIRTPGEEILRQPGTTLLV